MTPPRHRPVAPDATLPRVVSHGCRLNAAEAEAVATRAREAGLGNVIVHNTCAVTTEATRSARRAIRRSARENPGASIVVTGCGAHTDAAAFAAMPEVEAVIGNDAKLDPITWERFRDFGRGHANALRIRDLAWTRAVAPHLVHAFQGRARAFVGVQNGCDHSCTFCIIPKGRGPSRSVPAGVVVEGVRRLVGDGAAEIVLTGVDLTSWGGDLPGRPRLGTLVQSLLRLVPDMPRLRLSSIDSIEADPALLDALEEPRLMPHLHLSLQHGHDLILKRMRRRHSRRDAVRFCEEARARRPDMALGADLIAGFPTEDPAHHGANLSLIGECGLVHLHVFPFSARTGTPAARMPQVPGDVVRQRAADLRARGRAALASHLASRVGSVDEVVVHHGTDAKGRRTGLARDFCTVALAGEARAGTVATVTIEGTDGETLLAGHCRDEVTTAGG